MEEDAQIVIMGGLGGRLNNENKLPGQRCTFRCSMAILAGHPDRNRTGAVIGLNVRGEEWGKADERGEKGSSSPSMGFGSSPPLCRVRK